MKQEVWFKLEYLSNGEVKKNLVNLPMLFSAIFNLEEAECIQITRIPYPFDI